MRKVSPAIRCLFVLPAVLWFCAAIIVPVGMAVKDSFYSWDGITAKVFLGLDNYKELLHDEIVWKSLKHSLEMAFWCVLFQLPIGMFFAVILYNRKLKGRNFFRTAFFLPVILSSSLIGILWGQIFDPNFGLLNGILNFVGSSAQPLWLGDPKSSLGCVIAVVIWQFIGNYILIYYTALHNVSEDIMESAMLDGAKSFQLFTKIQLPLIWPVIRLTLILATVNSLKYFDLVYIMTGGGPNSSSEVLATYVLRTAFNSMRYGYGNAVAVVLLFLGVFFISLYNIILKNKED